MGTLDAFFRFTYVSALCSHFCERMVTSHNAKINCQARYRPVSALLA